MTDTPLDQIGRPRRGLVWDRGARPPAPDDTHWSKARLVNSGPLSTTIVSGSGRVAATRSSSRATRAAERP